MVRTGGIFARAVPGHSAMRERWLAKSDEERAALLAQSHSYTCEHCADDGHVWMARNDPRFESARIKGAYSEGMGETVKFGRRDIVRVWCDRCPAAVQRWRQLQGIDPSDVTESRFETYNPVGAEGTTAEQRRTLGNLLGQAKRWASRVEERRPFLVMVGPAGIGKSHLAKAAAIELAEHGYSVRFITAARVLDEIRATFDREAGSSRPSTEEAMMRFAGRGVLVLDDLGAEYSREWGARTLEAILAERYERRALTVITANKNLNDLGDHQGDPHLRLVDRLGDVRRTVYVEASAPSWRTTPRRLAVVK